MTILEIDEHGAARDPDTRALKKFDLRDSRLLQLSELLDASILCLFGLSFVEQPDGHSVSGCVANEKWSTKLRKRHNGGGHPQASGANFTLLKRMTKSTKSYKKWLRTEAENGFSAFLSFFWVFSIQEPYGKINLIKFLWDLLWKNRLFIIISAAVAIS